MLRPRKREGDCTRRPEKSTLSFAYALALQAGVLPLHSPPALSSAEVTRFSLVSRRAMEDNRDGQRAARYPVSDQWYYADSSEARGPISKRELKDRAQAGEVTSATMVWREGMEEWVAAGTL